MPAKTPKSRLSKSATNKSGFKFRWWMGAALVVVIAAVGLIVLRFSQASAGGTKFFSVDAGSIVPGGGAAVHDVNLGRPNTAYNKYIDGGAGSYAQAQETYSSIVGGNASNVQSVDIQVCYTFYVATSGSTFEALPITNYMEILDWGGNQIAVQPYTQYGSGTIQRCINKQIGNPGQDFTFFYKFAAGGSRALMPIVEIKRITQNITYKNGGGTTPAPGVPAPEVPVVDYTCKSVAPAGTICIDQSSWRYLGAAGSNRDTGVWQNIANPALCGVLSAPGKPKIITGNVYYPVACPGLSAYLQPGNNPYADVVLDLPSFGYYDQATQDPQLTSTNAPSGQRCKIDTAMKQQKGCILDPNAQFQIISNRLLGWHSPSDAKQICIVGTTSKQPSPDISMYVTTKAGNTVEKKLKWGTEGLGKLIACTEDTIASTPRLDQMASIRIAAPADSSLNINRVVVRGIPIR